MGKPSRDKGKRGELRVCMILAAANIRAKRNLTQSRDGGDDIEWDLPICLEVKNQKTHNAWHRALEQARQAAEPQKKWWASWTHADRDGDIVHMPAELFVEMLALLRKAGVW